MGSEQTVYLYCQSKEAANGTKLAINVLSTLVLGCLVISRNNVIDNAAPVFVLSKGSPMSSYSVTLASAGNNGFGVSVTGGTILYDSVNGHRASYDHIIVSHSFSIPINTQNPVNAYLTMYIPAIAASDSGTYYCNYIAGASAASADSFRSSGSFTLTPTTKSGSQCTSAFKDKASIYSLALLAASKIYF